MTGYRSALLVALFGFSPVLIAQDSLDRELDFVRALAEKMKFIELAKEEVERLAVEHRGAGDQDRIAQLSVQISFHGAKARGDRSVQRTLYKEAIEKSKELIDRSSDAKVLVQARSTLADASQEFGQFLIEELELARETNPDAVKDLEEEAAAVFRAGIDACKKVREALEPQRKDPEKDIEFGLFWMRTGVLMREQGRAVKADRGVLVDRAIEELTELVLDFGEETAIGLRGLLRAQRCGGWPGQGRGEPGRVGTDRSLPSVAKVERQGQGGLLKLALGLDHLGLAVEHQPRVVGQGDGRHTAGRHLLPQAVVAGLGGGQELAGHLQALTRGNPRPVGLGRVALHLELGGTAGVLGSALLHSSLAELGAALVDGPPAPHRKAQPRPHLAARERA